MFPLPLLPLLNNFFSGAYPLSAASPQPRSPQEIAKQFPQVAKTAKAAEEALRFAEQTRIRAAESLSRSPVVVVPTVEQLLAKHMGWTHNSTSPPSSLNFTSPSPQSSSTQTSSVHLHQDHLHHPHPTSHRTLTSTSRPTTSAVSFTEVDRNHSAGAANLRSRQGVANDEVLLNLSLPAMTSSKGRVAL